MAITKTRKISSWTLIITAAISLVIFALFFFGGLDEPLMRNGEPLKNPKFTGLLLYWNYFMLIAATVCLVLFGIGKFVGNFRANPKKAMLSVVIIVAFAALLGITYSIGSGTEIAVINADAQKFNTTGWLKLTDMWLYSMYTLLVLTIIAMLGSSVKKIIDK